MKQNILTCVNHPTQEEVIKLADACNPNLHLITITQKGIVLKWKVHAYIPLVLLLCETATSSIMNDKESKRRARSDDADDFIFKIFLEKFQRRDCRITSQMMNE